MEKRGRPLGQLRCMWEYNIKMDFQNIKWESADWIDLAQDKDDCCESCDELQGLIKCGKFVN